MFIIMYHVILKNHMAPFRVEEFTIKQNDLPALIEYFLGKYC